MAESEEGREEKQWKDRGKDTEKEEISWCLPNDYSVWTERGPNGNMKEMI